jgi:hypothetical protein
VVVVVVVMAVVMVIGGGDGGCGGDDNGCVYVWKGKIFGQSLGGHKATKHRNIAFSM